MPSPTAFEVKGPAVAPSVRVSSGCCSNLALEKRFMRRMATRTRREKSGCPVRPRKELPVQNTWRRSRKAINRELHAFNGNTSTPVAASPVRGTFDRGVQGGERRMVWNASLAPTFVVPPTPALPAGSVSSRSNAQPVLDMADGDDMDALFPATMVGAPTGCPSAHGDRGPVGEFVFARGGNWQTHSFTLKRTSMTWALLRPRKRLQDAFLLVGSRCGTTDRLKLQVAQGATCSVPFASFMIAPRRGGSERPMSSLKVTPSSASHGGVLFTYHGFSMSQIRRRLLFIDSSHD